MGAYAKYCAVEEIVIIQRDPPDDEFILILVGKDIQVKVSAISTFSGKEVGFGVLAIQEVQPRRFEFYIYVEVTESALGEEEQTRITNALYGVLSQEARASYGCKAATFFAPPSSPSTEQCLAYRRHISVHPDH